jgi:hypothetical protein
MFVIGTSVYHRPISKLFIDIKQLLPSMDVNIQNCKADGVGFPRVLARGKQPLEG